MIQNKYIKIPNQMISIKLKKESIYWQKKSKKKKKIGGDDADEEAKKDSKNSIQSLASK